LAKHSEEKISSKKTLTQAMDKPGSPQYWSGLMKVKPIFYKFCERILVSGNKTRFWEDVWVNKQTLAIAFSRLYDLNFNRNITVDKVVSSLGLVLIFRRQLWGDFANEWLKFLGMIKLNRLWGIKILLLNHFIMLCRVGM
jgi:hypothetical protein